MRKSPVGANIWTVRFPFYVSPHARLIVIWLSLLCPFLFHMSLPCSTDRYFAVFVVPFPISPFIVMLDLSLFGCLCRALSYFIPHRHARLVVIWLYLLCPFLFHLLLSCLINRYLAVFVVPFDFLRWDTAGRRN